VRLPGGALLIDTPGIRSLGVAGAADGLEPAFADIAELAAGCRFSDCRHEGEPGCAVRAALADGTLSHERLASHRKLEREAAHVARSNDPLLREAERRRWRAIHIAVNRQMQQKYGSDR
jgi:ribosome biogenesis GTPase